MSQIIKKPINEKELRLFLGQPFDDLIKFVMDIEEEIVVFGGEMHADAEEILLGDGSEQKNLWGGNIYPEDKGVAKLEYESFINIKPSQNNRSMKVQDKKSRIKIKKILEKLVKIKFID